MNQHTQNPTTPDSRWPHRLATLLVCAVFPLIWVGGLVTSSDAGMAVPDWPNTYGYNLFLYPWVPWRLENWNIYWNVYIEHFHRLLGSVAGFLSIGLMITLWWTKSRRSLQLLGIAAFLAILSQGIIGGMRVHLNERLFAMFHACTGPLAFAVCVAAWYFTKSRATGSASASADQVYGTDITGGTRAKIFRLALLTTGFAYIQLVLGAIVRHMPVYAPPRTFHTAVMFHLFMAGVLTIHVVLLAVACYRAGSFRVGGSFLASLIVVQLSLGIGTWIVNFGFPQWVNAVAATPDFVVRTHSWPQLLITTAHVAIGSLILVTSLVLALKSRPMARAATATTSLMAGLMLREALQ